MTPPTTIEELRAELERVQKQCAEMREALKPFAACNPSGMGSTPRDKIYLWKPSQTSKELPGISVAHIDAAKQALAHAAGTGHFSREKVMPFRSMSADEARLRREIAAEWRERVMPLVSAIDTIYKMAVDEKEVACEINTLWLRKHCAASLVHARTIGVLKEDAK